jgi:Protein of unknown function (DUF3179)
MPKRDHYKRTEESISSRRKNIVPLDQIVSGGLPPDGIPSIDKPKFISVEEADKMLQDSELVVGVNINEDIRAYPLQILVWHEIVNYNVGGVPVAITLLLTHHIICTSTIYRFILFLTFQTYLQISDIFPHFIKVAYSSCLFFSVNSLYWAKR